MGVGEEDSGVTLSKYYHRCNELSKSRAEFPSIAAHHGAALFRHGPGDQAICSQAAGCLRRVTSYKEPRRTSTPCCSRPKAAGRSISLASSARRLPTGRGSWHGFVMSARWPTKVLEGASQMAKLEVQRTNEGEPHEFLGTVQEGGTGTHHRVALHRPVMSGCRAGGRSRPGRLGRTCQVVRREALVRASFRFHWSASQGSRSFAPLI
jgi:hypothetical protein